MMVRSCQCRIEGVVALLLVVALAACSTTSTVHKPVPPAVAQGQAYAYAFANSAGDEDPEGVARLDRLIHAGLLKAGLVATSGESRAGRVEVELTHYYVRSNAARFWAGILAGRDRIASRVTVRDERGAEIGSFDVETTNVSAWGGTQGLMEEHADEIVSRLGTDNAGR